MYLHLFSRDWIQPAFDHRPDHRDESRGVNEHDDAKPFRVVLLVNGRDLLHKVHGPVAHVRGGEPFGVEAARELVHALPQTNALLPQRAGAHLVHPDVVAHQLLRCGVHSDLVEPQVT